MEKYFTQEEIEKILVDNKVNNYNKDTLLKKTKYLFDFFTSKKISKQGINKMILDYPRLLTLSLDLIKNRYNNIEKTFQKRTNQLLISNSRILSRNNEEIKEKIKYFINLGLNEEDSIRACLECSRLTTVGILSLDINIDYLENKINDKGKLIELIRKTPHILSHSVNNIENKFNWFYNKGYTKEQTVKIICKAETILTREFEKENNNNIDSNIERKYKYLLEELKYTKEQIIDITYIYPEDYTLSLDTIKNRINNLLKLGFDNNAVKILFYKFPQIISFKESTLNEKYEYYFKLDMLEIFAKSPKYLIQRLELTDARYTYLINKGLEVNQKNYGKLFISDKRFKETYGIDNEELLKIYREKEGYYEQRKNKRNEKKYRTRNIESK